MLPVNIIMILILNTIFFMEICIPFPSNHFYLRETEVAWVKF